MGVYKQNMSDADWSSMDDTHESLLNAEDRDFIVQFANVAAHVYRTKIYALFTSLTHLTYIIIFLYRLDQHMEKMSFQLYYHKREPILKSDN